MIESSPRVNLNPPSKKSIYYPILVLSLCGAFLFYKYIIQNFPSVISIELMNDFDLRGLGLGMLSGGYFWTYLIVPLFVGVVIDTYGTRWVTAAAIFLCGMSVIWFSQVSHLNMAILTRGLMGVGVSFATIAYMKLAATWFAPKKYALLIGLLLSSAMAGAVVGQMPFAWLVQQWGWRSSLFGVGFAGIILAVLFMMIVRDAPTNLHHAEETESQLITWDDILQVFKNKQNWLLMFYSGLAFSPIVIFSGLWGNPFLQEAYQVSAVKASSLMSLVFIGLGIGSPAFAMISNHVRSRRNLMIYCTLLSAISVCFVLYCHPMPAWLVGTFLFIFGFSLGAFPLVFVIGKESNPLRLAGTAIAMINASDALLDAITEPLIGRLLDVLGHSKFIDGTPHFSMYGFHLALAILPIFQIIGSLLLLGVKEREHKVY